MNKKHFFFAGQLPFELAPEELGNAEADFIDFVLSNPDLLFNAGLDSESTNTDTSQPQPTTPATTVAPNHIGTEQPSTGTSHVDETTGNTDSTHGLVVENGMVRDPVTGKVTHVRDIHDGGLLEVIESEITGGHIIDSHTGELILLSEINDMLESAPTELVAPVTTVTLGTSGDSTTPDHSEHNHPEPSTTTPAREVPQGGTTPQKQIINGVIRDPVTGQITHIVDPHDGAHLEVIDSPIFGAHVFDPHSGDLIIAEDHALQHGTVDIQPQSPTVDTTTLKSITTTEEVTTTTETNTTTTVAPVTTTATTPAAITTAATTTMEPSTSTTATTTTEMKTTNPITTTTKAPVDNTVKIAEATTPTKTEMTTETATLPTLHESHNLDSVKSEDFVQHGVYVNKFTPSPSGSNSVERQDTSTKRRKFGNMKGIYSVLDKYKSEYLKRRKDGKSNDGNSTSTPNLNTVLKWIERRKNLFKQVLQEKKHIEEEKKQNPKKQFQVLDLETYFPSLKRNKFGGLEARNKWRGATDSSKSQSSGGSSTTKIISGGNSAKEATSGSNSATRSTSSGSVEGGANRWRNPFLRNSAGGSENSGPSTDRRTGFQRLMATKLENQRKQTVGENQQVTPMPRNRQDPLTLQATTQTPPQTTTVNNNNNNNNNRRRKKFNNFFRNKKPQFSRRSVNSQESMKKENSVGNYFKSLKDKVNENTAATGQKSQTPETYVAGLARRLNNKIVARNPQNVQLRKDKWNKSYLAEQIST